MTQSVALSSSIRGVEAVPVEVQADLSRGLPCFTIVGLADPAVLEARDRVRSALRACGFDFPSCRIVVNLAPAPMRKHGTGFDLPIAVALLAATAQIPASVAESPLTVGELGLDGAVRPVAGILAHALRALDRGRPLMCATQAAREASLVPSLECLGLASLGSLRAGLPGPVAPGPHSHPSGETTADLADVRGHRQAKRVLEIAAAGGHNLLFVGPPGSGKTMLARRLPGILPPLTQAERLSTAASHSVAGLDPTAAIEGRRPFRAPHHSASTAGLVGGGSPPRPGETALAHNGVLFLDELPEFGPSALQALRQPLEDGSTTLVRADGRVRYPSRFALVGAMNPCPCGYSGDRERECTCPPGVVSRYQSRVGGPLLDRVDLHVRVDRVDPGRMFEHGVGECSADVRRRVIAARSISLAAAGEETRLLSGVRLLSACALDDDARDVLVSSARACALSGRGVTRVLRVARTIADLAGGGRVRREHITEALCYRGTT